MDVALIDYRLSLRSEIGDGHEVWNATLALVKNLSEVVLQSLPGFWRVAKAFMDGKFKKVSVARPFIASRFSSCR